MWRDMSFRQCPLLFLPIWLALFAVSEARAADPVAYTVSIAGTGNSALDKALSGSSELESLRTAGAIPPFALVGRAELDIDRLQTVLQSFGYYDGKIAVQIDGRAVSDPGVVSALESLPAGTNSRVEIAATPGPLYQLGKVTIEGELPDALRSELKLAPGQPAVASEVLAAQTRLLTALQEQGYAQAQVQAPVAYLDPAAHVLNVVYNVHAGPRVTIGEITIRGLQRVNESLVRKRLLLHPGERYSPSSIEKARQDLLSLGVFSGISVRTAENLDSLGRIPIEFDMQERLSRVLGFTGAYSTDLGGSVKATWSHRNLFGNAEQLNLSAGATGLGGSATSGIGYDISAQFIQPEFLARDQSLALNLGALNQRLEAYDQKAVTAGASLTRKFSERWSASGGISGIRERIIQQGVTRNYSLLGLPINVKYNSTGLVNALQDPVRGIRAAFTATPTHSFGPGNTNFVILQANGAAYFDLASRGWTAPGRSVLAVRGLIGSALGASQFELPPDQRFYGGGSATVRGFRYQSIGPQFPDNTPIGGTSIDAGTVEFRQRIGESFGAAAFVDAGQVGTTSRPFEGTVHVGAGLGVRYYTGIGPIRFDFAVPVNRQPGGDAFEIYIGLGQAF